MRRLTIGLLVALALGWGAIAAGLRWNGSASFPEGLYLVKNKTPRKGDLVLVKVESLPAVEVARNRGYLNIAYSPVSHLLKRIAGVAGDRITIDTSGVEVNGIRLNNSTPLTHDGLGRTLQPYILKDYILGPGEALLMSEYSAASFDSRYFGPVTTSTIESVVRPLLTWN